MVFRSLLPLIQLSAVFTLVSGDYLGCLDGDGNPVDSFHLYKLPMGLEYIFLTDNSSDWILDSKLIDDKNSFAGRTITQLSENDLVIMYNDEPPEGVTNNDLGHTKGVVAANSQGGFWLIHSVPKYPGGDYKDYKYPPTGHHYGQSFLCISLRSDAMEIVGKQLLFNEPNVYFSQVPENIKSSYPNLASAASKHGLLPDPPFWSLKNVTSRLGMEFVSFAKSKRFNKELYIDFVAPTLRTDLMVESWLHGPGRIDSECDKKFSVFNIEEISMSSTKKDFSSMQDHSKWGVSKEGESWICVGDINRAEHQKMRGGGTMCQKSPEISSSYRNLVKSVYPCPRNNDF